MRPRSGAATCSAPKAGGSGRRDSQLPADRPRGVVIDLPVPRNGALTAVGRVDPDGMSLALAQRLAAVRPQVSQHVHALHDTAPAGTSRTSVLATRWR